MVWYGDIHISVDFEINMLFHIVNRYTKQQNMQKGMHKLIEYVKIVKLAKFVGSCLSYLTYNIIKQNYHSKLCIKLLSSENIMNLYVLPAHQTHETAHYYAKSLNEPYNIQYYQTNICLIIELAL